MREDMNRVETQMESTGAAEESVLKARVGELTHDLEMSIFCMASLAESREAAAGYHVRRTREYVALLADALQGEAGFEDYLTSQRIELLKMAAPLHDIGKVAIADRILLKKGPLNRTEWEEMKRHTTYGRDALLRAEQDFGTSSFLEMARVIAYSHHERWDGKGYPEAKIGEEIPPAGRIMALADVYDALISRRVYKGACSHREAVEKISRERGAHFDPVVVDAFLQREQAFLAVARRFADADTAV